MAVLADVATWVSIAIGAAFALIGAFGMVRLPDVFARMHAAGIIDTVGIGFLLIGLMFQAGFTLVTVKLALILVFVFFTSPTATHALAQAALKGDVRPRLDADDGEQGGAPSNT